MKESDQIRAQLKGVKTADARASLTADLKAAEEREAAAEVVENEHPCAAQHRAQIAALKAQAAAIPDNASEKDLERKASLLESAAAVQAEHDECQACHKRDRDEAKAKAAKVAK